MNIYDEAHNLARALKTSEEYQTFLAAKRRLDTDSQAKVMVKDFLTKQMTLEYDKMTGKGEDKGKAEHLQRMAELLAANAGARDFLQAHMRFQRIMADVYKILGESIAEGMDIFAQE